MNVCRTIFKAWSRVSLSDFTISKNFLTLASMFQPSYEEFKPYDFNIKQFMEILGVSNQSKYTEIPKIISDNKVDELKSKFI